jgi:hypothetical protein
MSLWMEETPIFERQQKSQKQTDVTYQQTSLKTPRFYATGRSSDLIG